MNILSIKKITLCFLAFNMVLPAQAISTLLARNAMGITRTAARSLAPSRIATKTFHPAASPVFSRPFTSLSYKNNCAKKAALGGVGLCGSVAFAQKEKETFNDEHSKRRAELAAAGKLFEAELAEIAKKNPELALRLQVLRQLDYTPWLAKENDDLRQELAKKKEELNSTKLERGDALYFITLMGAVVGVVSGGTQYVLGKVEKWWKGA